MEYVSISNIFKDLTSAVELAVLPQLQAYDEMIQGVHFEHGHYLEIAKVLQSKENGNMTDKLSKWPLIALFRDFPEKNVVGLYSEITVTLIIAKWSNPQWTSDQREANSFIPVLYPVFNALLEAIDNDSRFIMQSVQEVSWTKIDHYYWGSQTVLDKTPNIFNEWTDSIELRDLTLKINPQNC